MPYLLLLLYALTLQMKGGRNKGSQTDAQKISSKEEAEIHEMEKCSYVLGDIREI